MKNAYFLKIVHINLYQDDEYIVLIKDRVHGVSFWRKIPDIDSIFTFLVDQFLISSYDNSNLEFFRTCNIKEIRDQYEYLKLKSLTL